MSFHTPKGKKNDEKRLEFGAPGFDADPGVAV
jgi:hypothetical protein